MKKFLTLCLGLAMGWSFASAQAPSNDICSNAKTVVASTDTSCASAVLDSLANAMQEKLPDSCTGAAKSPGAFDVWYKFTATATTHIIDAVSQNAGLVGVLYNNCTGSPIGCANPRVFFNFALPGKSSITAGGLVVGNTYYVRIYAYGANPSKSKFTLCIHGVPTPPSNDICANAKSITASSTPSCITVAGSFSGASQEKLPDSCAGGAKSPSANDIWYSFVAPATTMIIEANSATEGIVAILYSACGGNILGCANPRIAFGGGAAGNSVIIAKNLVAGSTYYIRLYPYPGFNAPANENFTLCVHAAPPAPANDLCSGATLLTTSADTTCNGIQGKLYGANQESGPDSCRIANPTAYDVWYTFKASAKEQIIDVSSAATQQVVASLYDGCGGKLINCAIAAGAGKITIDEKALILNHDYFVRVYKRGAGLPDSNAKFTICLHMPPPPPANDSCKNAKSITAASDTTCNSTKGTLYGARQETPAANCGGAPAASANDVWYTFSASATAQIIDVTSLDQSRLVVALYSSCGGTLIQCQNPPAGARNSLFVSGLTVGTSYRVRVYATGTAIIPKTNAFNICVHATPPPPANDLCASAVNLTVDSICQPTAGTVAYATQSAPAQVCNGTAASPTAYDVWYSFTAKGPEEIVTVNAQGAGPGTGFGAAIELYDGCSGNQVDCQAPLVVNGVARAGVTRLVAKGLTPAKVYFVRVYQYGNTVPRTGNFAICVTTPLANDECSGAVSVTVAKNKAACAYITVNTVGATNSNAAPCDNPNRVNADDDVWFKFKAPDSTVVLTAKNFAPATIRGFGAVLYKKGCSFQVKDTVKCVSASPDSIVFGKLKKDSLYYLDVYTAGARPGTFDICLYALASKGSAGIERATLANSLSIYPNPVKAELNISFMAYSSLSVRLINIGGQQIYSESFAHFNGEYNKPMNLGSLPSGIYMLQIVTEKESVIRKVIKE